MKNSILEELLAVYSKEEGEEQFKIRFTNILTNHLAGWWRNYEPGTCGNVIHWIYTYSMLSVAENVQVGNGTVTLHGEDFATYTFDDKLNIPVFDFCNKDKHDWIIDNQRIYLEGLEREDLTKDIIEKYETLTKSIKI